MVIDTLFMCFCEDVSQNDGSPGKEYYAPPSLMDFMNESGEGERIGTRREDGGGDDQEGVAMRSLHSPAKEEAV